MTLDPRPARTDLTSRECAKLLGGLVGALVPLVGAAFVRSTIRITHAIATANIARLRELDQDRLLEAPDERAKLVAVNVISGLLGGLSEMAPRESVVAALAWWAERDDAWKALEKGDHVRSPHRA